MKDIKSEMQEIKEMIKYMPGGIGYIEAKEDFYFASREANEKQKN